MSATNGGESIAKQQIAWSKEIPNYGDKLLKRLDEFRKSTILYDVRLHAEGGDFNAHKVILAACGGIFRSCFVNEETKMIDGHVSDMKLACPAAGLKPIIRFAYSGSLIITNRIAIATMLAAEETKMREVQEICASLALKEHEWIIREKNMDDQMVTEKLDKILRQHAGLFLTVGNVNHDSIEDDEYMPYLDDVRANFPEHFDTYTQLSRCLRNARNTLKKPSDTNKRKNSPLNVESEDAPVENNFRVQGEKQCTADCSKSQESDRGIPESGHLAAPEVHRDKMEQTIPLKICQASEEKFPKDIHIVAPEVHPEKVEQTISSKISQESEEEISKRVELATPDVHSKKVEQNISPKQERTTVKPKPRSIKPRASVKKAPAPQPTPSSQKQEPKSPKNAPPRPMKQPNRIPPPRPRPPEKKTHQSDDFTASKIQEADDYDDTLNPFA